MQGGHERTRDVDDLSRDQRGGLAGLHSQQSFLVAVVERPRGPRRRSSDRETEDGHHRDNAGQTARNSSHDNFTIRLHGVGTQPRLHRAPLRNRGNIDLPGAAQRLLVGILNGC